MTAEPDQRRAPGQRAQVVALVLASIVLAVLVGFAVLSWLESTA